MSSLAVTSDDTLRGRLAVVGIGETDYREDYQASRLKEAGYVAPTSESLAIRAFERALDDAGLRREDVDGLSIMLMEGGEPEYYAKLLGIRPQYTAAGSWASVPTAARVLADGQCSAVACLFSTASRSVSRVFGGATYTGAGRDSYYYYHPWRWSSQAAHWALMARHYMATYGTSEEDLGHVALMLRDNARLTRDAVMQDALTIDDYLASRYIVQPLHLLDLCMVNDGAVCLIVRPTEVARDGPHTPVLVSGWGYADVHHDTLHFMIKDRLRTIMFDAGRQAMTMAGLSPSDIGHLELYDVSSIHLVNQLEGFGFVAPGEGLDFIKEGNAAIGGTLPVNTSGGMLSHSYMAGWNSLVETVRQLRHEAGARQVEGLHATLYAATSAHTTNPIVFTRAD